VSQAVSSALDARLCRRNLISLFYFIFSPQSPTRVCMSCKKLAKAIHVSLLCAIVVLLLPLLLLRESAYIKYASHHWHSDLRSLRVPCDGIFWTNTDTSRKLSGQAAGFGFNKPRIRLLSTLWYFTATWKFQHCVLGLTNDRRGWPRQLTTHHCKSRFLV
jgi:hypothetical protein